MGVAWVAGVTRARAVAGRCLGAARARELAAGPTLDVALRQLTDSPYRRYLQAGAGPAAAQRAVTAALLWQLRVLAGWQPPSGVRALRVLATGFEISNAEGRMRSLLGREAPPPYQLGSLATAWPRLAAAGTPAELRSVLTRSPWGDPGGETPAALAVGMRIAAASRTAAAVPAAAHWAAARAALLVARERFVHDRRLTAAAARRAAALLGGRPLAAGSLGEFREALPPAARWALGGVAEPGGLWRAEAHWWHRVEQDGVALLRGSRYRAGRLVGAAAVLSADAWRVRGALELADRGGRPAEEFDVLV